MWKFKTHEFAPVGEAKNILGDVTKTEVAMLRCHHAAMSSHRVWPNETNYKPMSRLEIPVLTPDFMWD